MERSIFGASIESEMWGRDHTSGRGPCNVTRRIGDSNRLRPPRMERSIFEVSIESDPTRSRFGNARPGPTSPQNPVVAHLEVLRSGSVERLMAGPVPTTEVVKNSPLIQLHALKGAGKRGQPSSILPSILAESKSRLVVATTSEQFLRIHGSPPFDRAFPAIKSGSLPVLSSQHRDRGRVR